MPTRSRHAERQSTNRAPKRDPPRVLRSFGQFLQVQRDTQHGYNLHHAQVHTLTQPIVQEHGSRA